MTEQEIEKGIHTIKNVFAKYGVDETGYIDPAIECMAAFASEKEDQIRDLEYKLQKALEDKEKVLQFWQDKYRAPGIEAEPQPHQELKTLQEYGVEKIVEILTKITPHGYTIQDIANDIYTLQSKEVATQVEGFKKIYEMSLRQKEKEINAVGKSYAERMARLEVAKHDLERINSELQRTLKELQEIKDTKS